MIYLDHAAATPVSESVFEAMKPYFMDRFFNPSAPYWPAVELRREYEEAKDRIARCIGAKGVDLVITASATESINLAFAQLERQAMSDAETGGAEILISGVEHPAVLANAERWGNYQVVAVDQAGELDLADFEEKLNANTQLVSVCLASGELGTIQPVAAVAELVMKERLRRQLAGEKRAIYLHCDASQAIGLLEVKVNRLKVDMLTLNAAKIYGPKGAGALWIGHQVKAKALTVGGGQEMGLRSGTENVAAVMGFAKAMEMATEQIKSNRQSLAMMRQRLKEGLTTCEKIRFLGTEGRQLVNFLPITVEGIDAERLIFKLEQKGVFVSTGAACAASKGQRSKALAAIGLNEREIAGSLRLSLGHTNHLEEMESAGALIVEAIEEEWRRVMPEKNSEIRGENA